MRTKIVAMVTLLLQAGILTVATGADHQVRAWKHIDGVFGIDAAFVELKGETLVLRRPNGKLASVPLSQLCMADREIARELAAKPRDDATVSLGVRVVDTADFLAARKHLPTFKAPPVRIGAVILDVFPGGSADAAQLKPLDIIYRVNRKPVEDAVALGEALAEYNPNDFVLLKIVRRVVKGKRIIWQELEGRIKLLPEPDVTASPLRFIAVIGSSSLDDPKLIIEVRNVGRQVVVAAKFEISCFNRFDEPVLDSLTDADEGTIISQHTIAVGATYRLSFTYHWRQTASKMKVILTHVKMADGSTWEPPEGREESIWAETLK